jgi:dTDP-4-amino-4,6-dideoxygalactose transaminase
MSDLAILGGKPAFAERVPITLPTLVPWGEMADDIRSVVESGVLTNGPRVAAFEAAAGAYLGVPYAVAVSSCTSGLMLTLRCLGIQGEVILPSFTFVATALAVVWNGLTPVFVDSDYATHNIDPAQVEAAVTPRTSAIVATYVFGNPPRLGELEEIAVAHDLKFILDAAHAFGAIHEGRTCGGFGDAEVMSLTPTKLLVAGEGGLITTRRKDLAGALRLARNYGSPPDYDTSIVGLNARMPEINAVIASKNLARFPERLKLRQELAARYRSRLSKVPGIEFQVVEKGNVCTYKDFSVLIDEAHFGLSRDGLAKALAAENVETRPYFSPAVHRQRAIAPYIPEGIDLPITDLLAGRALSLPLFSHMDEGLVDAVAGLVARIQGMSAAVRAAL